VDEFPENQVIWPIYVQILEGKDKPLFTIPEPERKIMWSIDFIRAGKPGMVKGKLGTKNSPTPTGVEDPSGCWSAISVSKFQPPSLVDTCGATRTASAPPS
jgi:hypothetical protein